MVDPHAYDFVLVAFSGGKDSTAAFLHLLDLGVEPSKIELHHHEIDGRENCFMDWPSTPAYCRAFARTFHVPLYASWRLGGFKREMLRENTPTAPIQWENPDGTIGQTGGKGPAGTRLKFPQVSADLSTRWCSAYLKIDVCSALIRNQPRFLGKRTLLISGERAEESPCRAHYRHFEEDRTNSTKRLVHRWRPIHGWKEQEVWDIIERYRVTPHPAYQLGWSRLSCRPCIFGNADQWASLKKIDPDGFGTIHSYERQFQCTIHRRQDIAQVAAQGEPYRECNNRMLVMQALNPLWQQPIITDNWNLPAGAFRQCGGPS